MIKKELWRWNNEVQEKIKEGNRDEEKVGFIGQQIRQSSSKESLEENEESSSIDKSEGSK